MSNILIIGGHGKVARLLAPKLVERGHTVSAVIRQQEQAADVEGEGIKAVVADVEQLGIKDFEELIAGHDAVIWSAGAGGGSPERTYRVDRDGAIYAMQAAQQVGVKRFVMVSWAGSTLLHGVDESNSFFHYAQSKFIADAVLRDTELDWTILGPTTLTLNEETDTIDDAATTKPAEVSRANVAEVAAASLDNDATIGKTIRFSDGETPIAEFIAQ